MAVPKRKTSRARRDARRANHAAVGPSVAECPRCHSPKLSHRVCPNCGMYNGRQVVNVEEQ
jgi:large subunit ribosomal protein L32